MLYRIWLGTMLGCRTPVYCIMYSPWGAFIHYEVGFWTIFGWFLWNMKPLLDIFCGILAPISFPNNFSLIFSCFALKFNHHVIFTLCICLSLEYQSSITTHHNHSLIAKWAHIGTLGVITKNCVNSIYFPGGNVCVMDITQFHDA